MSKRHKKTDTLTLPIIHGPIPQPKSLSMDEYAHFVALHVHYTLNKKVYREQKRLLAVHKPFVL